MWNLQVSKNELKEIVLRQMKNYWLDIDETVIDKAIPGAVTAMEKGFANLPDKRFFDGNKVRFSPYISIQWMIFLYRLAHEIFLNGEKDNTPKEADQIYYLNKIMHANDWFYAIELPEHFLCEHPLGSVLGRASYGDYLFVYHGTTIGGNRTGGQLSYPSIGNNVILYSNASVLGG